MRELHGPPDAVRLLSAPTIFVDADACPVKEEIYRVARRTGCPVQVVANAFMRVPPDVTLTVVDAPAGALTAKPSLTVKPIVRSPPWGVGELLE